MIFDLSDFPDHTKAEGAGHIDFSSRESGRCRRRPQTAFPLTAMKRKELSAAAERNRNDCICI